MNPRFFWFLLNIFSICGAANLVLRIDRFDFQIPPNSIFHAKDVRLNFSETRGTLLSHDIYIDEYISGKDLNLKVVLTRCSNQEALDTCENFKQLNPSNFCFFFDMKGMAWSELIESFQPPVRCPFHEGRYILDNKPLLNADLLKYTMTMKGIVGPYWKAHCKYFNKKTLLFETDTEFRFVYT